MLMSASEWRKADISDDLTGPVPLIVPSIAPCPGRTHIHPRSAADLTGIGLIGVDFVESEDVVMQPSSPLPGPRKPLSAVRLIIAGLVSILLVAMYLVVIQVFHGASPQSHVAAGPFSTPTTQTTATDSSSSDTPSAGGTPAPGQTPAPTAATGTSGQQTGDVRVTQNQDMRPVCLDGTAPYTVKLYNAGTATAQWHVSVPMVQNLDQPYWAEPTPQDGTIAAGQAASFVMKVVFPMPCSGQSYKAAVQLRFPPGTTQPDLPLTYAGTGPAAYSNIVLASGSMTSTEACPTDGSAPAPFTIAITNTGNSPAGPAPYENQTIGASKPWANTSVSVNPPGDVPTLIYPGQVWTYTISPQVGVSCTGTPYYFYIQINNAQGSTSTLTFTYTFTTA